MDDDISLLNAIVKNTEMGTSSLDQIIDAAENEAFKSSLQIQKQKSKRCCNIAYTDTLLVMGRCIYLREVI